MGKRIAIVGCGGIGGVSATLLADAGHDVTAITSNESITAAIREHGLRATIDDRFYEVPLEVYTSVPSGVDPFEVVLVAAPPTAIYDVIDSIGDHVRDDGILVTFPNGLIEEHAAKDFGEDRLVGGIVSFGASMIEPGRVRRTAGGGVTLGRLNGALDSRLDELEQVLEPLGTIEVTRNLRGARWSKLAINCAISSLGTLGGDRLGALLRHRFVRRLALETMTEVVQVAQAEGVELEKVSGTLDLEWLAMSDDERARMGSASLLAKHTVLLAVGARYRKMRSSMLRAIERGRKPSVEFLNGEITERARRHGIETPINQALLDTVLAIADGRAESSLEILRGLYDQSRPAVDELLSA